MDEVRIDKFLWSVRLFKTRSLASEACQKGHVLINDVRVKPSRLVRRGETFQLRRPPVVYTYKILDLPPSRVGPKLVELYLKNITTGDQIALVEVLKLDRQNQRAKGLGRPTKKERREIDSFLDSQPYFIDDDDWN